MEFILYLGLVITMFATGESLQCYNCLEGSKSGYEQVSRLMNEYRSHPPTERCIKNNGEIVGPQCTTQNMCVAMDVVSNDENAAYHFCSFVDKRETTRSYSQSSGNEYLKANFNLCSENLCNSASHIVQLTSLLFTLLITLFFL